MISIKTNRLILREFTRSDLRAIYEIFSDREANKFLPWLPIETVNEAKLFYERKMTCKDSKTEIYYYAICLKVDDFPIGYVTLSNSDSHDLGYGLCKEFWHKGIVTEACLAVIEKLRKDGVKYITATHDINNPRSGKVMKKLGMKYQYSYEEQWLPKDILVTFRMYQLNLDCDERFIYKKY